MTRARADSSSPAPTQMSVEDFDRKCEEVQSEFSEILKIKTNQNEALQAHVGSLQEQLPRVQENIDDNEAYERRDCLVFSRSAIPPSENGKLCINTVKTLVEDELKIKISTWNISVTHRLGRKRESQGPDRRPLVANSVG